MKNTNTNIPVIAVKDAINALTEMYTQAFLSDTDLKKLPTPFLSGAPGVGKSEGVYQLADALSRTTSKRVVVTEVRLLLFSPVDLRGVPVADQQREFTDWLKPRIFDMDDSEDCINILFLDELSAATQLVQATAYQICLNRCAGEHRFPDNCIVVAAGNSTTDGSVSYRMPKALANRMMHFRIEPCYAEWKDWALRNGIDERIIGYLSFDNSMLCAEPDNSDTAYPTPRSWSFVSELITNCKDDIAKKHILIAGCVGLDTALAFEEWCKVYDRLPKIEDIFAGRCRIYPRSHDALFALISGLTSALYRMDDTVTDTQLEHVCSYAYAFPSDYGVSFFSDLSRNEKLKSKLMSNHAFNIWLSKNGSIS